MIIPRNGLKLCIFLLSILSVTAEQNCFTLVIGKRASVDGHVIIAHNEDNYPEAEQGLMMEEGSLNNPFAYTELPGNIQVRNSLRSYQYWGLVMPDQQYSNILWNSRGVILLSNRCDSRDPGRIPGSPGVGGAEFRRLIIQRSSSARQGIKNISTLIERYGYNASGRSIILCDSKEAWIMALLPSGHWVAQRVPDNHIAVIANSFTIQEINFQDNKNLLMSEGIVEHAEKYGLFNKDEGPFSFEKSFASAYQRVADYNLFRQQSGYFRLSHRIAELNSNNVLPFSIAVDEKIQKEQIMLALRDHLEGEIWRPDYSAEEDNPHLPGMGTPCNESTNSSTLFDPAAGIFNMTFGPPCRSDFETYKMNMNTLPVHLILQ